MLGGEGDDGEAADNEERRAGEDFFGLDGGERLGVLETLANLDAHHGDFRIAGVDAGDGSCADGCALIAGVVEDPLCSGFHFAEMLNAGGVGDSVPDGFLVAEKVVEGVDIGLGLEEEAGHGDDGKAGNGGQGMEKKGTSQQRFSSPRSLALSPRTVPSPCPLAQSRIQD